MEISHQRGLSEPPHQKLFQTGEIKTIIQNPIKKLTLLEIWLLPHDIFP